MNSNSTPGARNFISDPNSEQSLEKNTILRDFKMIFDRFECRDTNNAVTAECIENETIFPGNCMQFTCLFGKQMPLSCPENPQLTRYETAFYYCLQSSSILPYFSDYCFRLPMPDDAIIDRRIFIYEKLHVFTFEICSRLGVNRSNCVFRRGKGLIGDTVPEFA
jgi:hypothetical protein